MKWKEIEEEFHSAYETVWESMSVRKCNKSNVKPTDPLQRTCCMEESMPESFQKKEKLIEQTVNQGNMHTPEPCGAYSI